MSRGRLDKRALSEISKKVPDLTNYWQRVRILNPNTISIKFVHESRVPIAAVCLNDTLSAVGEATYALRESYAHYVWYRAKSNKPIEYTSIYFARYYSDDVALRLYTASEHLANSLVAMLPITKKNLKRYKKKQRSQASVVGRYLMKQRPFHPLTTLFSKLHSTKEWREVIEYRNEWVHNQPPLIAGLGIQYSRKPRWEETSTNGIVTGHRLYGGGGDKPKYTVDDLQKLVSFALFAFLEVFDKVIDFYFEILAKKQITLNINKNGLSVKFP
jgi:hypothetical protein